jgi:tetratricopeptide (TPR) repeat protein
MKWTNVYYLTFIFLCAASLTKAGTPPAKEADSLYALRQFGEAAIAYERAFFESADPVTRYTAIFSKVECLKQTGRYQKARNTLDQITKPGLPDSILYRTFYESALCSYLGSNFEDAESQFLEMEYFVKDTNLKKDCFLLRALNYNELINYPKALAQAEKFIRANLGGSLQGDSLIVELHKLFRKKNLPHIRNPKKAIWFSMVIPGAGQAWVGYPGEGLISFGLSLAALSTGVIGFLNGYYFTGYLVGAGLLQKFYFGGLRHTEYLADKSNYRSIRKFNGRARDFLLGIQGPGLK